MDTVGIQILCKIIINWFSTYYYMININIEYYLGKKVFKINIASLKMYTS